MFAFENIVRHSLGLDVDVKTIRAAFRTVEETYSPGHLSFPKLLTALVSSTIGMFARPMLVLQQNWRELRRIKEDVAEKVFLASEANMLRAADRFGRKLHTSFVDRLVRTVKRSSHHGHVGREKFFGMLAQAGDFLSFELNYFFGRVFDIVARTGAGAEAETFALVVFVVLMSSLSKEGKAQAVFSVVDCDDDGCLAVDEVHMFFRLLVQWSGLAQNDPDSIQLDGDLTNFELSRQQARRLAHIALPATVAPHSLINFREVNRGVKLATHRIPGIQNLRWLLPAIPPYAQVWTAIVQVRTAAKRANCVARRLHFHAELLTVHQLHPTVAHSWLTKLLPADLALHFQGFDEAQHRQPHALTVLPAVDSEDEADAQAWLETETAVRRKLDKARTPMDPLLELKANIARLKLAKTAPDRQSGGLAAVLAPLDARPHTVAPRAARTAFGDECAARAVTAIRGERVARREFSDSDEDRDGPEVENRGTRRASDLRDVTEREFETFDALTFGKRYVRSVAQAALPKATVVKVATPFNCFVCRAPHKLTTLKRND